MYKEETKLPADIYLKCFVCNEHEARHLCMIEWKGLDVKLCLCPKCTAFNLNRLPSDLMRNMV